MLSREMPGDLPRRNLCFFLSFKILLHEARLQRSVVGLAMNVDPNPYLPPQTNSDSEAESERPLKRMLLQASHAFLTIFGIVVGWALIGSGMVQNSTVLVVLGIALIVAACCFGLLMKVKQKNRRRKDGTS